MKKIIASIMLFAAFALTVNATTYSVTVTNNSTVYSCTYYVGMSHWHFTSGANSWHPKTDTYHTIAPGNSYTWNITPPAGYTPDWNTLDMACNVCSVLHFFDSDSVLGGNCMGCSGCYVTRWVKVSQGNYELYADCI